VRLRPIISARRKLQRPLEEIRPQLRRTLKGAKRELVRAEYVARLRKQASVTIFLTPPKVKIDVDRDRLRGNPNAPVTVVEFSDFQCPCCKQAVPTLKELLAKYPNQVPACVPRLSAEAQIHPQRRVQRKRRTVPAGRADTGTTMTNCSRTLRSSITRAWTGTRTSSSSTQRSSSNAP
jgi:Thioredoxin